MPTIFLLREQSNQASSQLVQIDFLRLLRKTYQAFKKKKLTTERQFSQRIKALQKIDSQIFSLFQKLLKLKFKCRLINSSHYSPQQIKNIQTALSVQNIVKVFNSHSDNKILKEIAKELAHSYFHDLSPLISNYKKLSELIKSLFLKEIGNFRLLGSNFSAGKQLLVQLVLSSRGLIMSKNLLSALGQQLLQFNQAIKLRKIDFQQQIELQRRSIKKSKAKDREQEQRPGRRTLSIEIILQQNISQSRFSHQQNQLVQNSCRNNLQALSAILERFLDKLVYFSKAFPVALRLITGQVLLLCQKKPQLRPQATNYLVNLISQWMFDPKNISGKRQFEIENIFIVAKCIGKVLRGQTFMKEQTLAPINPAILKLISRAKFFLTNMAMKDAQITPLVQYGAISQLSIHHLLKLSNLDTLDEPLSQKFVLLKQQNQEMRIDFRGQLLKLEGVENVQLAKTIVSLLSQSQQLGRSCGFVRSGGIKQVVMLNQLQAQAQVRSKNNIKLKYLQLVSIKEQQHIGESMLDQVQRRLASNFNQISEKTIKLNCKLSILQKTISEIQNSLIKLQKQLELVDDKRNINQLLTFTTFKQSFLELCGENIYSVKQFAQLFCRQSFSDHFDRTSTREQINDMYNRGINLISQRLNYNLGINNSFLKRMLGEMASQQVWQIYGRIKFQQDKEFRALLHPSKAKELLSDQFSQEAGLFIALGNNLKKITLKNSHPAKLQLLVRLITDIKQTLMSCGRGGQLTADAQYQILGFIMHHCQIDTILSQAWFLQMFLLQDDVQNESGQSVLLCRGVIEYIQNRTSKEL